MASKANLVCRFVTVCVMMIVIVMMFAISLNSIIMIIVCIGLTVVVCITIIMMMMTTTTTMMMMIFDGSFDKIKPHQQTGCNQERRYKWGGETQKTRPIVLGRASTCPESRL